MSKPGTEEELRAHLAAIVDSSDDAIISMDLDGVITSWNSGAVRLYGYSAEEAPGRSVSMLVPEGHRDEIPSIMERVRRGERIAHYETVRRTKDGRRLNISLAVSPIKDANGNVTGASAVGRDITDRRAAQEALARQAADLNERTHAEQAARESEKKAQLRNEQFETLLNQAPLGVYFVDADFRLQQVNPAAESVFDEYPGGGVTGRDFAEILHTMWGKERAENLVPIFKRTLETGEPHHVPEFAAVRADRGVNEYYDWRIERIVLPDGRYGVVCYFRDISEHVNARLAIAESEERFRTLFNSTGEGFCVIEMIFDEHDEPADYRFVEMNPAFERHTGLNDAVGRRVLELVPDLERRWFETYSRVAKSRESTRFVEHSRAMGRWFEVEAFPTGPPEKRRVALLFSDITQSKQAEDALRESEERLRLAKNAAGLGIHDYNPLTGEIGWDERTREIWGVDKDEPITYELWREGLHPDDRDLAQAAVQRALDPAGEGVYFAEYRTVNRRDGTVRWTQVTGQASFVGGQAVRLVGTVQDITERKRADDALREADRRKDEFLATLSHELRNPLAAIRTALTVLNGVSDEPARVHEMAGIIERQSSQLVLLIDDLLEVSRISRGKARLELSAIDLVATVRDVIADFQGTLKEKGVNASVTMPERPLMVEADPVRIAQVINNLLSNACKFTPRGGNIDVYVDHDGEEALVRVADTGIGMARDELPRIFEMFTQIGDSPERHAGGLGIGLSLAKSLIELHGGTIEANSEGPGQGSEFVVRLRALKTPAGGAPVVPNRISGNASATTAPRADSRRIVAADDNADALRALTLMLRMQGHDVETATDGDEALEKVLTSRPHVALLDIGMPGKNGYEVAAAIRQQPWGQDVMLVAITGWGQESDKRRALEAGFDVHLTKPVDSNTVELLFFTTRKPLRWLKGGSRPIATEDEA